MAHRGGSKTGKTKQPSLSKGAQYRVAALVYLDNYIGSVRQLLPEGDGRFAGFDELKRVFLNCVKASWEVLPEKSWEEHGQSMVQWISGFPTLPSVTPIVGEDGGVTYSSADNLTIEIYKRYSMVQYKKLLAPENLRWIHLWESGTKEEIKGEIYQFISACTPTFGLATSLAADPANFIANVRKDPKSIEDVHTKLMNAVKGMNELWQKLLPAVREHKYGIFITVGLSFIMKNEDLFLAMFKREKPPTTSNKMWIIKSAEPLLIAEFARISKKTPEQIVQELSLVEVPKAFDELINLATEEKSFVDESGMHHQQPKSLFSALIFKLFPEVLGAIFGDQDLVRMIKSGEAPLGSIVIGTLINTQSAAFPAWIANIANSYFTREFCDEVFERLKESESKADGVLKASHVQYGRGMIQGIFSPAAAGGKEESKESVVVGGDIAPVSSEGLQPSAVRLDDPKGSEEGQTVAKGNVQDGGGSGPSNNA